MDAWAQRVQKAEQLHRELTHLDSRRTRRIRKLERD
ncbi:MAG: hypothetical protein JWR01_2927 [Subtercola sp.]|nr:hypothetical protein [Subtercola sp.]